MKNSFFLLLMICTLQASAQITIGSAGITIKSGTTVFMDSMILIPGADLSIASNSLQKTNTSLPPLTGTIGSMAHVYKFTTPFPYTGVAGFRYTDAQLAGNLESNIQLAYASSSSNPVWITMAGSTVDATNNLITNSFTATTLGKLSATSSGTVLPLLVNGLKASLCRDHVQLQWNVNKNELYNSFSAEVSTDGARWTHLSSVVAANQDGSANYECMDADMNFTTKYYRVLLQEKNNDTKYTNTVTVKNNSESLVQVSSIRNGAVFSFINTTAKFLRIIDMSGKVILETNSQQQQYTFSDAAAGIYILQYELENGYTGSRKFNIN